MFSVIKSDDRDYVLEAYVKQLKKREKSEDYILTEFSSIFQELFNKQLTLVTEPSLDLDQLRLTNRERRIFDYLWSHKNAWTPWSKIFEYVYDQNHEINFDRVTIYSHISHIRTKIKSLDLDIYCSKNLGYKLAGTTDQACARYKLPLLSKLIAMQRVKHA